MGDVYTLLPNRSIYPNINLPNLSQHHETQNVYAYGVYFFY